MSPASPAAFKTRLDTVIALAQLLERVEASRLEIGADQYRALVRQLMGALDQDLPDAPLKAILRSNPAASELYENLHYARSGLSRAALDRSVASEMATTRLLARIAALPSSAG